MSTPTEETYRILDLPKNRIGFSPEIWAKIDAGTLDVDRLVANVAKAHHLLTTKAVNVEYTLLAERDRNDEPDLDLRSRSFQNTLQKLRTLIQSAGDHFDINAICPNDSRECLMDKLLENKKRGEAWSEFSIVPLFELLDTHGVPFHEYMLGRSSFNTPITTVAGHTMITKASPHSILDRPMDPPELAYILKKLPQIHIGFLADIMSQLFPGNDRSQFFDECITVALQHGASLYEVSPGWTSNAMELAEGINHLDDNRKRNGTSRGSDPHALEMLGPTLQQLRAREEEALTFHETFIEKPKPELLTHDKLILLANIDELDPTLSTLRCDKPQARAVLKEVATLPLFVIDRIPIAISRLERIAGENLITSAQHGGKVGQAPARAMEGGNA